MPFSVVKRVRVWLVGDNHSDEDLARKFTCGTLRYTPATLAVLFGWLLWGDFTFTLMENEPSLLIMQAKSYHLSDSATAFLLTTLATLCNFCLNPVISSWSDRHRGRLGRRRPFLLIATPIVALTLTLIPWAPEITQFLQRFHVVNSFLQLFPATPLLIVFGLLILGFRVANMFINTVYYYLLPDVIPEPFIGRFYGLFRTVGILAATIFDFFIFPKAQTHMHVIFAALAILCAVSFTVMCWKVKEGDYPAIEEERGHWYSGIVNYFVECFGKARYLVIFLIYGSIGCAGAGAVFMYRFQSDQLHLTDGEIGPMRSYSKLACALLAPSLGMLVDRVGGRRAMLIALPLCTFFPVVAFFGMHGYWSMLLLNFTLVIPGFLLQLVMGKWTVDMYPRAQYGQFASAGAAVGALGAAVVGVLFGWVLDKSGHNYRLCLLVPSIFSLIALGACLVLGWYWPDKTPEQEPGVPTEAQGGFEPVVAAAASGERA